MEWGVRIDGVVRKVGVEGGVFKIFFGLVGIFTFMIRIKFDFYSRFYIVRLAVIYLVV